MTTSVLPIMLTMLFAGASIFLSGIMIGYAIGMARYGKEVEEKE